ncbi:MAG: bacterial Ig-like domain-containing protein [Clostridia bacterium]|nr:bacterial Ig-like domain-containing protein [Clostridia bacterium]
MKKTFFGSRVLAVVLTLAMVLSFAGVLPLGITASAADPSFDGYIYNGDFETGTASPWKLNSGSSIVTGGHNGSGYAVRFQSSSAWSYFYQKVNIQPDTDYRVTFWVKRVAGTSSHNIYIYDPNDTNNIRPGINGTKQWFNYTSDEWVKHVFEFNSGTLTTVGIYFKNSKADDVFLYDDISLKELPTPSFDGYIYNGDFETGDEAHWTLPKGASIVAGGHDGSDFCAKLAASAPGKQWEHIKQVISVEPNSDYRLTGWVKRVSGSGAHYLYAQGPANEKLTQLNDTHQWFTYANEDWVQHVWEFNSASFESITIYMMIEDPDSVFLYDDVTLEKLATASSDGYITNGDFETGVGSGWIINSTSSIVEGGRNGSGHALKLEGGYGKNVKQAVKVDGMTDYALTVRVKRVSGTGTHKFFVQNGDNVIEPLDGYDGTIDDTGDEWCEHVYKFNSGKTTQITVFLQIVDGSSAFLYDDITMAPITGPDYSHVLKGDVDLDGDLDKNDVTLLQQHLDGEITLEGEAAYAADMNYDGAITADDVALLRGFFSEEGAAVLLYPINGEEVAKGAWQVDTLLEDYTPGKSDGYSGIGARKDQYARDDIELHWLVPRGGARSYHLLLADNPDLRGAKEYLIQNNNEEHQGMTLQNLLVDTDYYWAIDVNGAQSAVGTFHTANTVSTLWIEGVSNTRDLGGWITEDGLYRVKYNVAFRGARFDNITDAGLAAVADLGIKTDVDLRTQNEGVQAPLGDLAAWHLVGSSGAAMYYSDEAASIGNLTSPYVAGTVEGVRVYADASNFPAYFHCSYGRDRTGTLGLMLLGLCGVGRNDILADYELTFLSEWGGGGISASGHTKLLTRTMDWLQETYAPEGTLKEAVEGYLLSAGLTADEISAVRANMLERIGGEPEATGVEVTALPDKTAYLEGKDELDVTGAKLTVYYDDDSSEEIDVTADMVSGFDNTAVGPQTLTVTYGEFTATFEIEITAKSLTGIDVTVLPGKLDYVEGEEFDPAGLEITAYYDNDTSEVLAADAYTLEGFESTVGEHVITVSYGGKTAAFTVNVAAKTLESIEVTALPTKLEYVEGEEFDAEGIEVTAYYDNNTSEVLAADAYTLEGFESTVGEHIVTVTYGEKTDTFTVTVVKKVIPGDIDGDGEISVNDALLALRVAAQLATFEDEAQFRIADVDHDGEITVSDALRILRVAAKIADPSSLV